MKTRKIALNILRIIDLLVIFSMTLGSPISALAAVWTDQADYSPGSVVTISGDNSDEDNENNWLPGEIVHVAVLGPNGYDVNCLDPLSGLDPVADEAGAWSCQITLWDSLLASSGLLVYRSGTLVAGTAPYWIVAMWLLFSTTLNVSLSWLKGRLLLAAVVGAISGPLAFYGGHKLGAVDFPDFGAAMLALAVGWALILPGLVYAAGRLNGFPVRGLAFEAAALGRRQTSGY